MSIMSNQTNTANPLMDIALRIREMREIFGFTVPQMAEKAEISQIPQVACGFNIIGSRLKANFIARKGSFMRRQARFTYRR